MSIQIENRYGELADRLVSYSTNVKKGDLVILETFDIPNPMIASLVNKVHDAGGHPVPWIKSWEVLRAVLNGSSAQEIDLISDAELMQMKKADVYIGLRASMGSKELEGVSTPGQRLFQKNWLGKVHYQERVQNTRWCSMKWPTEQAAAAAGMSYKEFEKYYLDVCLDVDYPKMAQAMIPLVRALETTDKVRIIGKDTDVSFSKKGIPSVGCAGTINIPDGEIYTAPIKESVEGVINYNVASTEGGEYFEGLGFKLKAGKIVDAWCDIGNPDVLKSVLSIDEGASFIGEFAFGVNPLVKKPVNDRMFDEKMEGSIHLTPGNSYKNAFNGNKSSLHWDLILSQSAHNGGGEIYFDDMLVRKDGLFVLPGLVVLNPDNLIR